MNYQADTVAYFPFTITSSTGAATNADSTPTATLYVNGTADAASVTVTNNSTGAYTASVTIPSGASVGDDIAMLISATVSGVASKAWIGKGYVDATISSRSTYAGGDTSGTTTLLSRLTSTRATNIDNLDATISSRSTLTAGDVWNAFTSGFSTVGSAGKLLVDNLNATVSSVFVAANASATYAQSASVSASLVESRIHAVFICRMTLTQAPGSTVGLDGYQDGFFPADTINGCVMRNRYYGGAFLVSDYVDSTGEIIATPIAPNTATLRSVVDATILANDGSAAEWYLTPPPVVSASNQTILTNLNTLYTRFLTMIEQIGATGLWRFVTGALTQAPSGGGGGGGAAVSVDPIFVEVPQVGSPAPCACACSCKSACKCGPTYPDMVIVEGDVAVHPFWLRQSGGVIQIPAGMTVQIWDDDANRGAATLTITDDGRWGGQLAIPSGLWAGPGMLTTGNYYLKLFDASSVLIATHNLTILPAEEA